MARVLVLLIVAALASASFAILPASATTIVAVVDGTPITSYDLAQRQKLLQLTGVRGNLRQKALEELIDEEVQLSAASRQGVTVPEADVDSAVAQIAERVKLTPAQLKGALGQSGISIDTLRSRFKAQIAFGRLTRGRFASALRVSEQDLVAALLKDDALEKVVDTYEYDLQQVIVAMPKDPSPQRRAAADRTAASMRQQFTSCNDGIEMAKRTKNVVVRPFGRRTHAELSDDAAKSLEGVAAGRLGEPFVTPLGLMLLAVCEKTEIRSTNAAMKALQDDMQEERTNNFVKQYLRQLRRDAVVELR